MSMSDCIIAVGTDNRLRGNSGGHRTRMVWIGGKFVKVYQHRVAYEQAHGQIPPGMVVMHSCDNPPCVNPDHLIIGTQSENVRDMYHKGRDANQNTAKTVCTNGHPFTPENTYNRKRPGTDRTYRICRECYLSRQRERRSAVR